MSATSGYRERQHTADWELEVWALDLSGLFEQAARGMYALAGVDLGSGSGQKRQFVLEAVDKESLIVQFLEELLYILSMEWLAFDEFHLEVNETQLQANLVGTKVESLQKEIKAVTFHNIHIEQDRDRFVVRIVFDV